MYILNLSSANPFFNLAVEECLLKSTEEEYLILYVNDPSVIIGKHQISHRETDTIYVTKNKIPVVRRISGGGTVYHDPGNLNFTFIIQSSPGKQVDFRKYSAPVIDFLATLGVKASFEGKNDLKVEGLKISGNAEHVFHNRVLHHGTLLFSTDLDVLRASLRKDTSKYLSRAVESNPSHVTNLKNYCSGIRDIDEFRAGMISHFLSFSGNSLITLPGDIMKQAASLEKSKFRTWEWNYAYGPGYQFNNTFEHDGKLVSCNIRVRDGIIHSFQSEGSEELKSVAGKLAGCRHMPGDIEDIFQKEGIKDNFTAWMF